MKIIIAGAWYLSQGLIRGAMRAGEYFNTTTPRIINNIPSAEQPQDIPEPLSKTMQIAETTTNKAAKVTEYVGKNPTYGIYHIFSQSVKI